MAHQDNNLQESKHLRMLSTWGSKRALLRPSDEAASSPAGHLSQWKMLVMGIHRQDENPQYEGLEKQTQKTINQASSSIRISLAV